MKSTSDTSKSVPDTVTGEWSVFKFHKLRVLDQPDGVSGCVVAETQTEEYAEQIVRDHNAVPGLVAALKGVAIMLNTELERYEPEPWAQRVREALAAVDQTGVSR